MSSLHREDETIYCVYLVQTVDLPSQKLKNLFFGSNILVVFIQVKNVVSRFMFSICNHESKEI